MRKGNCITNAASQCWKVFILAFKQQRRLLYSLILVLPLQSLADELLLPFVQDNSYSLYQQADWLIDPLGKYSPQDLVNAPGKFRPYTSFHQPLNPRGDALWLRFTLRNTSERVVDSVISAAGNSRLAGMELYWIANGKLISKSVRPVAHQNSVFYLPLSSLPGSSTQYLVYWPGSIDNYPIQSLQLQSENQFQEAIAFKLAVAYLTVGIIFGLTIYNLFLYLFTRENTYIYCAMYVAFTGVFFSLHDEIAYQLLPDTGFSVGFYGKIIWWSVLPAALGVLLFSREILDTKHTLPRADKILRPSMIILLLLIVFGFMINHGVLSTLVVVTSSILLAVLLVMGLLAWRNGQPQARLYVVSFVVLFVALILSGVTFIFGEDQQKLIPIMEFARYGLIINLILLSIALANRINRLKQQQASAQVAARAAIDAADLKGKFLASMSHEIRTPINGVIGMAQIIRDKASNKVDRKTADILLSSADTLLNVVNDILDLSKIEAGKLRIDEKSFELGLLLANVAALFYELNKNSDIHFEVNIDGDIPDFVVGDELRLNQVLYNLLNNAFKFTEKGSVKMYCQLAGSLEDGYQALRFSVHDTGIGIAQDEQNRLFDAYEQVDQSSTRRYGGTGLGLSISKQLVELMGGVIGVNSTLGEGSEFWFTLHCKVDLHKAELLQKQREQLQGKRVAIFYATAAHSRNEAERLQAIGASPLVLSIGEANDITSLTGVDAVLTSDQIGPGLKTLLEACGETGTPVIVARSNFGVFEKQWLGLANIRKIYIPVTAIDIESTLIEILEGDVLVREPKVTVPEDDQLKPNNILVVEDNVTNQLIIKSLLESLQQNITVVDNGSLALQAYCAEPGKFDLILMDCEMPIMDGYEATRQIRLYESGQGLPPIPICALTAHAMDENYLRCKEVGMDEVIIKPVKLIQLKQMIARRVVQPAQR